jgi:hypothetical protein
MRGRFENEIREQLAAEGFRPECIDAATKAALNHMRSVYGRAAWQEWNESEDALVQCRAFAEDDASRLP